MKLFECRLPHSGDCQAHKLRPQVKQANLANIHFMGKDPQA